MSHPCGWRDTGSARASLSGMGIGDKAKNKVQEATGGAKESAGKATGNDDLKNEGRADQGESKAKQAGENIKDAAKNITR